jgi:hypothetical protein
MVRKVTSLEKTWIRSFAMFCNYCGANNPDDARFCHKCGKQVVVGPQVAEPVLNQYSSLPESSRSNEPMPAEYPVEQSIAPTSTPMPEARIESLSYNTPVGQSLPQSASLPSSSLSSQAFKQNVGFLIAAFGGLLGLFAFFFLTYINLGFLGTLTGSQLASVNNQLIQGAGALWLEPLVAVAIIGMAVYPLVKSQKQEWNKQTAKGLAITLLCLAALTLLILFIRLVIDSQPPAGISDAGYSGPTVASLYGGGMWTYFTAMLAVLVGSIVQLRLPVSLK